MKTVCLLLFGVVTGVSALVNAYLIDPRTAAKSGRVSGDPEYGGVTEVITCNFDSLSYVELFAGVKGAGRAYTATVFENNTQLMTSPRNRVPDHGWVRFKDWDDTVAFTKGKSYEFRFTRVGNDSVNYYYQSGSPYQYGHMRVGSTDETGKDLCCRVYGRLNATDSTDWGVHGVFPHKSTGLTDTWVARLREAKVGRVREGFYWGDAVWSEKDTFNFDWLDTTLQAMDSAKCEMLAGLIGCPHYASTHYDSIVDSVSSPSPDTTDTCWSRYGIPKNLWPGSGETNHWVVYLETLVHYSDSIDCPIHNWEIWNEPNDTCQQPEDTEKITGWWRRPNARDYLTGFDSLRGMATLYMRMCSLACRVITRQKGHENDRILIGSVYRTTAEDSAVGLVSGARWVNMCYRVAEDSGWGIFWDGVAVHPYQDGSEGHIVAFDPVKYESDADTIRKVMRSHGDYGGELWNTEIGWEGYWRRDRSSEAEQCSQPG